MKPPNDNEFKQPLDFAALGIEAAERKARKRLQKDLQATFDKLSRADLAEPKAYLRLFPPFTEYAQELTTAYFANPDRSLSGTDSGNRLQWGEFQRALVSYIFPSYSAHVEEEGTEADDDWEEPRCPEGLWEELLSALCSGKPSETAHKLPDDYEDSLVYIRHRGPWPGLYLAKELALTIPKPAKAARKPRGRQTEYSTELKLDVLEARAEGKTRTEQAQQLYDVKYVTDSQKSSTTSHLRRPLEIRPRHPKLDERCKKSKELCDFLNTDPWAQRALGGEKIPDPE